MMVLLYPRDDLAVLLDKAGPKLTVTVLLETLQHVMEFEVSVGRKFAMPVGFLYLAYWNLSFRVILLSI